MPDTSCSIHRSGLHGPRLLGPRLVGLLVLAACSHDQPTGPSEPVVTAPDIQGSWSLAFVTAGGEQVIYPAFSITNEMRRPDTTATVELVLPGGTRFGEGTVTADGRVHLQWYANLTGDCGQDVVIGSYSDGIYDASAADNDGRAAIAGNAGIVVCTSGRQVLVPEPADVVTTMLRKLPRPQ